MSRRALIVIDVQNEYVTGNLRIEYPDVHHSLANIAQAIDAAHAHNIPVVLVQHIAAPQSPLFARDSHGAQLHEVVTSRPYAHLIEKSEASAFGSTDLANWLAQEGIDTLVIAGYMTHNCDDATIKHAVHIGLSVEFLNDATGSLPYRNRAGQATAEEIHRIFSVVLQSSFAAVMSTEEWTALLTSGQAPVRDNIYTSNQNALSR